MRASPPCPDRCVSARVDREEQALVAQEFVQLLARHTRFDDAIKIFGMDRENTVHVAEVERHAAVRRVDVALERCAGSRTG
jgi:hypothetical protein